MRAVSRRSFLRGGIQAAGVLAAGVMVSRRSWADPLGLPIGIQLYTVGESMQKDAAATIRRIAEIGYKEVETAGFGSANSAAALRRLLDEAGLKCPSAHLNFDLKNLNQSFDDAHALGCTYATASVPRILALQRSLQANGAGQDEAGKIWARMREPMTADDLKQLIEVINEVGAAAARQGLKLGLHNHTFELQRIDGETVLGAMMQHTDPEHVVFEIDCGWITVAGFTPAEFTARFPGRVKMLHIKDFLTFKAGATAGGPDSPVGAEIGDGVVDYKKIFASLKHAGMEHIFVEQEGPFSRVSQMQAAEIDYKYLHTL